MTITWDKITERRFEDGVDRGVLYFSDGTAVPWNGLLSVLEKISGSVSPVYFDGMKVQDLVSLGGFSASVKAITYPDELVEVQGLDSIRLGFFAADQNLDTFALCYRTRIHSELNEDLGYKIHIIYNITAVPTDTSHDSITADPNPIVFQWDIYATPEEVSGMAPTAHFVIDSRLIDPILLGVIEAKLYGDSSSDPVLLPLDSLVSFMKYWTRIDIYDRGDGTWTASSDIEGLVESFVDGSFDIHTADVHFIDDETYTVATTYDAVSDPIVQIDIVDDFWLAHSYDNSLITETSPGLYEIQNANILVVDSDTYKISSTL